LDFQAAKLSSAHYAYHELPVQQDRGRAASRRKQRVSQPAAWLHGQGPRPDATTNKAVQAFDCLGLASSAAGAGQDGGHPRRRQLAAQRPETVAELTGGEYFKFENSRSLVRNLLTISNHVPNRYVLSFQPQSPHPAFTPSS
jgi:hypothetical protein